MTKAQEIAIWIMFKHPGPGVMPSRTIRSSTLRSLEFLELVEPFEGTFLDVKVTRWRIADKGREVGAAMKRHPRFSSVTKADEP